MSFIRPKKLWLNCLASTLLAAILILAVYRPAGLASPLRTSEKDQVQFQIGFQSNTSTTTTYPDVNPLSQESPDQLSSDQISRRILDAAPVLGFYEQSHGKLSNWMANVPDHVPITSMSIPGTHDAATWNYTQATQTLLEPVTGKLPPAIAFQCQDRSLFQMLGDGIRFFDLRVGFLPDHRQLGFFHASALLSTTATLPDALLGFYKWLDDHPSETILISIKVDNATYGNPPDKGQPSSKILQLMLYELLTGSEMARNHWLQEDSKLGTLGPARGKLIFIQRIDWDEIRGSPEYKPIGIPLPPPQFNDNDGNFTIMYNPEDRARAFVEDFYNILPNPTSIQKKFELKFQAVQSHLELANSSNPDSVDQLFITFASGGALRNSPPVTPKMLAIGSGEGPSLAGSVNGRIERLIAERSSAGDGADGQPAQRLGILIFDWYHQLPNLVQAVINQNPSDTPAPPAPSLDPASPAPSLETPPPASSESQSYGYDGSNYDPDYSQSVS